MQRKLKLGRLLTIIIGIPSLILSIYYLGKWDFMNLHFETDGLFLFWLTGLFYILIIIMFVYVTIALIYFLWKLFATLFNWIFPKDSEYHN